MNWSVYLDGLIASLILSSFVWLISVYKRDVSIVDSAWSLLFVAASIAYLNEMDFREWLIFSLLLVWATRLCLHITIRAWGENEDHRYQDIRKRYSPGFAFKSLFIIFVFQAVLAWIITLPLHIAFTQSHEVGILTIIATVIVVFGITFESIADWQLFRFKSNKESKQQVLDQGLWRYSRHPNYFGEAVVWWGFSLFAIEAGYWYALVSPILLTFLLLRFSGVSLLESTITERRPAYRKYIETTNAFLPGPKHDISQSSLKGEQL